MRVGILGSGLMGGRHGLTARLFLAVASLSLSAVLALFVRDASAQVYAHGDCLPPPGASYEAPGTRRFVFSDGEAEFSNLVLHDFELCSALPPGGSDAADTLGFNCLLDWLDGAGAWQSPAYLTMIVRFNHQEGPVRYYDTDADLNVSGPCLSFEGQGPGQISIEDLGGGDFRIDSAFYIDFGYCCYTETGFACAYDANGSALFTLASATTAVSPSEQGRTLSLGPTIPNPVRSHARIGFTVPSEDVVTLKVYDLAGRMVASLLDAKTMPAGPHDVELDTRAWRAGCYYLRLSSHGASRSQMMIVLR